jgi:hypothetical protein
LREFYCWEEEAEEANVLLLAGGGEVQPYQEGDFAMEGNHQNGDVLPNKVYSDKHLDVEVPETAHQISRGLSSLNYRDSEVYLF